MNRFRILNFVLIAIVIGGLSSCMKEKALKRPSSEGIGQTAVIEMGPYYTDQFFYSLSENKVLSKNSRLDYDLMFDCADKKFNIWLNTAKFMSVIRTGKSDIDSVTFADTLGHQFQYELGSFDRDSNAIGQWWETPIDPNFSLPPARRGKGDVYIINQGTDDNGNPIGFIKIWIDNFNYNGSKLYYTIRYAPVNQKGYDSISIEKDASHNYKYLSFANKTATVLENIEPDKSLWDLCFTRYTVKFYDPYYLPYSVTGVLHNPAKVSAYMDSTLAFDNVTVAEYKESRLETRRDAIGYNWKTYNGSYVTKSQYTYFIRADEDKIYKLHFFSFNKDGVKGYPSIEFKEL